MDDKLGRQLSKEEVENNPEFWEEIVEKDYEILKIRAKSNHPNIPVNKVVDSWVNVNLDYFDIYSVKRLSDGEVFTIGDRIRVGWKNRVCTIESIYYNEHKQLSFKIRGYKAPLVFVFTEDFPEKVKNILFTTEDGVEIFEGDKFYCVTVPNKFEIIERFGGDGLAVQEESIRKRTFSTKRSAEEYVLMNKPCLSMNDIKLLQTALDFELIKNLKEIVKFKL